MRVDFTALPDGPVPSEFGKSFGRGPGRVESGRWIHNTPEWEGAAAYLQIELPQRVTRIGCVAEFGLFGGAVALVAPTEDWSTPGPWVAPLHVVVKRTTWEVARYTTEAMTPVYTSGRFRRPLPFGKPVRIEATLDGSFGELVLPDELVTFTSPHLTEVRNLATVELFTSRAQFRRARLLEAWAD